MTCARKIRISGALLIAFAATALGATARSADQPADSAARAAIQATIDKAQAILVRSGSVKDFTDAFYEDDVMVSAQGEPTYRGLSALSDRLRSYMKDGNLARCRLKIIDPVRHSGKLVTAFAQEHCVANAPSESVQDARLLLVFRNSPKGWRVIQQLAVEGVF